jgi:ubiquinone/menaquinone biosynthesis C-methylase UbiE
VDEESRLFEVFLDVQGGLPRQGPGCDVSTLRALSLCSPLPAEPSVLDIGCGPGMQTMALAKALRGSIIAVDCHQEYLDQLTRRAAEAGAASPIRAVQGDMRQLPLAPGSFDLIWSEGAAYIMGFREALAAWKHLLKPAGALAVSELVWLRPDPPDEVRRFFESEYPAMTDPLTIRDWFQQCGYELRGHFTLPDDAWWQHYYTPLEAKLPSLSQKYAEDEQALGVIEMTRREIDMRRRYGQWYGYEFFVGRRQDEG